MATPYLTSNDLIASVQRKIAMPLSQNTFTSNDILAFANEEMMISQVPSVLQFHEEYFVAFVTVPMLTGVSRYPIPDRAIGMRLRDVKWMDNAGNMFDMTRIAPEDKAFFQSNIGANQAIHKFYVEGNDIVIAPAVVSDPTGSLIMSFFLRPNQLVKNGRASIVEGFNQTIKINNSLIQPLDTITLGTTIFTAVSTLGGTISAITAYSSIMTQVVSANHQLSNGQFVTIAGSDSNPSIDGTYIVTVLDVNTFIIPFAIGVAGTTGTFTSSNQFQIGVSDAATAGTLSTSINSTKVIINSLAPSDTVILQFAQLSMPVLTSNTVGFLIPQETIGIQFDQVLSTYFDNDTNVTTPLFSNGSLIDLLQTKPGHRTYLYDIEIPNNGISGNSVFFPQSVLMVPSGAILNIGGGPFTNQGSGSLQFVFANIQVGDYMCLSNESIIPQIPPDLHSGLAERTCARILASLGDQQGLQMSMGKIQEIEQRQGSLLDDRVEGTPQKITARHSLLRYGKMGTRRRT